MRYRCIEIQFAMDFENNLEDIQKTNNSYNNQLKHVNVILYLLSNHSLKFL